jgi:hypothetical protein
MTRAIPLLLVLLAGCGAKSGLAVPHPDATIAALDAGIDAGTPDAGLDAGPPDAGIEPEPCVEVPYASVPQIVDIDFEARIVAADIVFLVDNTASMGPLIDEIETTLQLRLIPGLLEQVPDLQMGIAIYRDFGFFPYGSPGDRPFDVLQTSTSDEAALQTAAERMFPRGGGDEPEAATEALYQIATGEGLDPYVGSVACERGFGAVCLREDAFPIVIVFTDAPFQNGPSLPSSYAAIRPPPHRYDETVLALTARGVRVLGMWIGGSLMGGRTRADLAQVALDTGALTPDGEPIVLDLDSGGGRPLVGRVVDAIETLVDASTIDVDAIVEDVEGDTVDATRFVTSITPRRAIPADGATIRGSRFEDVRPGTRVELRIVLDNDFLPPADDTRTYPLRVTLRADGVTTLRTRIVEVVVPGDDGGGCE